MNTRRQKIRHVYVAGGYPPGRGMFAHRSVLSLQDWIDTQVLHVKSMGLRRLKKQRDELDGIIVYRIPTFFLPGVVHHPIALKSAALSSLGRVASLVKQAAIIETASLYPIGFVAAHWRDMLGLTHIPLIANVTGSDRNVSLPQLLHSHEGYAASMLSRFDHFMCRSQILMRAMATLKISEHMLTTICSLLITAITRPQMAHSNSNRYTRA
jgi:hypothetical protein